MNLLLHNYRCRRPDGQSHIHLRRLIDLKRKGGNLLGGKPARLDRYGVSAYGQESNRVHPRRVRLHRSFQGYTTHANRDLVSFGVSAIGHVGDLFVQNHKLLPAYQSALASGVLPTSRGRSMSRDDHIRQQVINAVMCQGFVDIAAIEAYNAINFGEYFARETERLQILQADGLVELNSKCIALTSVGRLLMRTVAMTFDAYVNAAPGSSAPQPVAMSRVI